MAKLFLDSGDTFTLSNDNVEVFGGDGSENVIINATAQGVKLDQNVERVELAGASSSFTYAAVGATVYVYDGSGTLVAEIPTQQAGTTLVFTDGATTAQFNTTSGQMELGGSAVTGTTTTPAGVTPATIDAGDTSTADGTVPGQVITPTFSITAADSTEGGNAVFTVTLVGNDAAQSYGVSYTVTGAGGASASDYGSADMASPLTFAPGETTKTITIPVTLDATSPETGEGITLTLSSPTGTNGTEAAIVSSTATAATSSITDVPVTYAFASSTPAEVTEGKSISFTVESSVAVDADTTVTFEVEATGPTAADQGTSTTNLNDFAQGTFNPNALTMTKGTNSVTFTLDTTNDQLTELVETFKIKATVGGTTLEKEINLLDGGITTQSLTKGIDDLIGTSGDDTFTGLIADGGTDSTLNSLDKINGSEGNDTLVIQYTTTAPNPFTALPAGLQLSSIENITIASADDVGAVGGTEFDFSSITGLTGLNVTAGIDVGLKAGTTTAINVAGATGPIEIEGGSSVTVSQAVEGKNIKIGDATVSAGAVTVTSTDQGTGTITIDGGTSVTVTATADKTSGAIVVGGTGTEAPSGAVSVTQNINSDASGAVAAGDITVEGGSTIDVTKNIVNTASEGKGNDVTAGSITATAGDKTTSITVTQNNTATDFAGSVTAGNKESATVTFGALKAGEAVLIGETGGSTAGTELTFTAAKNLTAEEVAAAFANLTSADLQAPGGPTKNGIFTGSLDAGWTSGAASGSTVTLTATTTGNKTDLDVRTDADGLGAADDGATDDATFKISVTNGTADTTVAAQNVTATDGKVVADDNATKSVTTIKVDGFNVAELGKNSSLDALTDLTLKDGAGASLLQTSKTSLNLTLDGMAATSSLSLDQGGASITTLNLTTTGSASDVDFTAAAVTTLNLTAGAKLDVTGGTFTAVETATISGAGMVVLGDVSGTLKTLTGSSATGGISATVDGTKGTVTTGSGNDSITVDTATTTKNISLGGGNDTLTFSAATASVPTGTVTGGDGTDTVAMTSASAQALDGSTAFAAAVTGFERLYITDQVVMAADADITIDLEALGYSYVTTSGTDDTEATNPNKVIFDKIASGGTVVLTATQAATPAQASMQVNVKDAGVSGHITDVLNVVTQVSTADIDFKGLTVNNVETINISASDTNVDENSNGIQYEAGDRDKATLALTADSATGLVVDGNADLDLTVTNSGNTVTSINASAMTGGLTASAVGAAAGTTITGGTGNDTLSGSGSKDTLLGGAGNDKLTGADLTTLTGGDGTDTFVANIPTNVNSYSTITDITSGETIQLTAGESFVSSAITLAGTAVFQDYANATVNQLATDDKDAAWFQFGGNTFIIFNDNQADATDADFENGADGIIQITGLVDLSAASYNQTQGTLEIA